MFLGMKQRDELDIGLAVAVHHRAEFWVIAHEAFPLAGKGFPVFRHYQQMRTLIFILRFIGQHAAILCMPPVLCCFFHCSVSQDDTGQDSRHPPRDLDGGQGSLT
jgi:hypothetical protein